MGIQTRVQIFLMENCFLFVVQVRLLLCCDVYLPDESERVVDWWQFETDSSIHANHLEMFAPLGLKDGETFINKESVRSDKSWQMPCFFGVRGCPFEARIILDFNSFSASFAWMKD